LSAKAWRNVAAAAIAATLRLLLLLHCRLQQVRVRYRLLTFSSGTMFASASAARTCLVGVALTTLDSTRCCAAN
jgi:hypothetical protein